MNSRRKERDEKEEPVARAESMNMNAAAENDAKEPAQVNDTPAGLSSGDSQPESGEMKEQDAEGDSEQPVFVISRTESESGSTRYEIFFPDTHNVERATAQSSDAIGETVRASAQDAGDTIKIDTEKDSGVRTEELDTKSESDETSKRIPEGDEIKLETAKDSGVRTEELDTKSEPDETRERMPEGDAIKLDTAKDSGVRTEDLASKQAPDETRERMPEGDEAKLETERDSGVRTEDLDARPAPDIDTRSTPDLENKISLSELSQLADPSVSDRVGTRNSGDEAVGVTEGETESVADAQTAAPVLPADQGGDTMMKGRDQNAERMMSGSGNERFVESVGSAEVQSSQILDAGARTAEPQPAGDMNMPPFEQMLRTERLQEVIERFGDYVMNLSSGKDSSMTISLIPPNLGKIVLSCRDSEEGISVRIIAQSSQVREFLADREGLIREILAGRGRDLTGFDVRTEDNDRERRRFEQQRAEQESVPVAGVIGREAPSAARDDMETIRPLETSHKGFWYVA